MRDAGGDAQALIDAAYAEARENVQAKLRTRFEQQLLARAEALLTQPPAEAAGDAWWAYCIVPAGRELPGGLAAVADDTPQLVTTGGVAAVVSRVPLAEFGEEPLRANLNDLTWLERVARAHDRVLGELLPRGALVPLRVCTIYRDEAHVEAMLRERADEFTATLERLAGKAEWGIKVVADRELLEEAARESSVEADAAAGEGSAYLARKKLAALVREKADALVADTLREAHARLGEWADASVVLPAQNRDLSGHRGEMVLNAAYLVDERRVDSFTEVVHELELPGLAFELTGPWPPYNFAGPAR
jgi:hypothetical protein